MLEMKMAPAAKAYIVSGFPRSMRDVVEYSDKVLRLTIYLFLAINRPSLPDPSSERRRLDFVATKCAAEANRLWC